MTGEVTSEEQSSGDKSNSTNEEQTSNDKSNLANDADIRDGKHSNGELEGNLSTTQDIVETSNMNENVTTNDAEGNSEEVTTSNVSNIYYIHVFKVEKQLKLTSPCSKFKVEDPSGQLLKLHRKQPLPLGGQGRLLEQIQLRRLLKG